MAGCDGSHSSVRRQVGIERSGPDFNQLMVLAVFRSRELHERLKRFPPRSTYRVMHPDLRGYWQFFGRVDVGEGFFFHAPVPADTTKDNYDFHGLLQKAAGFEFACEFGYVDSGISVLRSPTSTKSAVYSSRAMQPTAIHLTGHTASTADWMMWPISGGKWPQCSKAGEATPCYGRTPRKDAPFFTKRRKISLPPASRRTGNSRPL